jgi:DeoR/GlpR family transcriptional regulator of sugar metabolism
MKEQSKKGEPIDFDALRRELNVVPNTIRSDLDSVFKDFDFDGSRGGPALTPLRFLIDPRQIDRLADKQRLTRNASDWLQTIAKDFFQSFVDGGTTCRVLYELLTDHPPGGSLATIYTNDLGTALQAGRSQKIQTILLPGKVTRNFTIVGTDTEEYVKPREFDVALLSCSEIIVYKVRKRGTILLVSTAATDEVGLKQAVISCSSKVALLADSAKIVIPDEIDLEHPPARAKGLSALPNSARPVEIAQLLARVHPRFSSFAFAFGSNMSEDAKPKFQASDAEEASAFPAEFKIFTTRDNDDAEKRLIAAFDAEFPSVLEIDDSCDPNKATGKQTKRPEETRGRHMSGA